MHELRSDPRIEEHADVHVKIQSAPEVQGLEGRVFPFQSEDVSLYGLKLDVDIPVPVGALLELEITLGNSPMKYWHQGDVVWTGTVDDDEPERGSWHDMGVRLHTQSNPQFDSWSAALSSLNG